MATLDFAFRGDCGRERARSRFSWLSVRDVDVEVEIDVGVGAWRMAGESSCWDWRFLPRGAFVGDGMKAGVSGV